MTLSKLKLAVLGALVVPMTSVLAEEAPAAEAASEFSYSANVGLYSDYIFRGYTQTKHQPAIQGGFDLEHSSGFYAGIWGSNVEWTTESGIMTDNSVEIDIYGGYATEVAGVGVDVGVLQFIYPGDYAEGSKIDSEATEIYLGLSKDFGAFSAGLTTYYVVSSEAWQFAEMDGETYVSLDVDVPVGPLTASFHVGHQTFAEGKGGNAADLDYTDWKVNVEYPLNDNFAVGAFYTDTDMNKTNWTVNNEYLGESVGGAYLSASF